MGYVSISRKLWWVLLFAAVVVLGVATLPRAKWKKPSIPNFWSKPYTARLLSLYQQVTNVWHLPVKVLESTNDGCNIIVLTNEIRMRLKKDASEDTVAHELMHTVLHYEGFPRML